MRISLSVLGLLLAAPALAVTPQETVTKAMATLAPNVKIDVVQDSVLPGFYEAIAGGEFVYVSKDGRYIGSDGATARKIALDKVGPDKRIVFSPQPPIATKHTVTVFTDVDCPFCRHLHEQIAQYNAQGIAVDYLFYPLSIHPGADKKAEAVWCSKDRPNAFTAAMSGKDPGHATCANPVPELTALAQKLGISGTPTMLAEDGTQIAAQIAMSPDQLAAELDRLAAASAAKN